MNPIAQKTAPVSLLQRLSFTLIMALLLTAFLWLASWQLNRAEFKQAILDSIASAPEIPLSQITAASPQFAITSGSGHYDAKRSFLLDNQVEGGIVGVHLYTPLQLPSGQWIMVNRGWLPMALDRQSLPAFTTPGGSVNISGRLKFPPRTGVRLNGSSDLVTTESWPQLVTYMELSELEDQLGRTLLPQLIELDENSTSGYGERQPRPLNFGPEKHKGYAITWFTFAIVTMVLYLIIIPMGRKPENNQ